MAPQWTCAALRLAFILLLPRSCLYKQTILHHGVSQFINNYCSKQFYFVPAKVGQSGSMRYCSTGFYPTKIALSKHGQTCLLIPGHDPPVDITIYMDISVNPGPGNINSNAKKNHTQTRNRRCYQRCEANSSHKIMSNSVLLTLQELGINRCHRGCRAGAHTRRQIPI